MTLVTLTGAFRNVGDHLIRLRAHQLLRRFVDSDILDINRLELRRPGHLYSTLNRARAVILCGGPAYQPELFPSIYSLDLAKVDVPVIPFGLGWKAPLGTTTRKRFFTAESEMFLREIHRRIPCSSSRDAPSVELLKQTGVDNVLMTGCPSWHDLDSSGNKPLFSRSVERVVVSVPVRPGPALGRIMKLVSGRFPGAERILTFHHGYFSRSGFSGAHYAAQLSRAALQGALLGFRPVSLGGNLERMFSVYRQPPRGGAVHIGFRLHAHIYCLTQGIPSFLINEDSRGESFALTVGSPLLDDRDNLTDALESRLDRHFRSRGEELNEVRERMRESFGTMKLFLNSVSERERMRA